MTFAAAAPFLGPRGKQWEKETLSSQAFKGFGCRLTFPRR
jgi:hypothetical protein